MSRPSAWGRVWQLFKKSFGKDDVQRKYVAEDLLGNKYYEIVGTRHNVRRGYDPATPSSPPPVREWQAWLKGTRRFPPSDEEININLIRQQAQRVEYSKLEQQAPQVETKGPGAGDSGPKAYPKYEDLEYQPGVTQKHDK